MSSFFVFFVWGFLFVMSHGTVVNTPYGALRGLDTAPASIQYLGIPFAQPPVGALRWKAPQRFPGWQGVRDATAFGADCLPWGGVKNTQGIANVDESCLYLNVFVPTKRGNESLPVAVWFYGGGWETGATSFSFYNGSNILYRRNDLIIVTVNYRLGALGFLASSSQGIGGNFGLLDQRFALSWVQESISAFGGDPARVTIWGESAGSASVANHLVMKRSWPYFDAAILESGPFAGWIAKPLAQFEVLMQYYLEQFQCKNSLDCLRAVNASDIQSVSYSGLLAVLHKSTSVPAFWVLWGPCIDGDELPAHPITLAQKGLVKSPVRLLLGTNTNEGTTLDAFPVNGTAEDYAAYVRLGLRNDSDTALKVYYPVSNFSSPYWAADALWTDMSMACPARFTARAFSINPANSVYLYQFNHELAEARVIAGPNYGVAHAFELVFVWGERTGSIAGPNGTHWDLVFTPEEALLRDRMVGYWFNFVTQIAPGGKWPLYSSSADQSISLNVPFDSVVTGLKRVYCDWWETVNLLVE